MRVHPIEKIKKLKMLRMKGYSINELVSKLTIPKTTVWHHIQGVKVLPKYIPILRAKRGGSAKRTKINWEKARKHARKLLRGPHRGLVIMIAMLYWGEGSKKACEFINSDGRIIQSYLLGLRKVLSVSERDIKPILRIFTGMNRDKCLSYWTKITKIPASRFTVRLNDGSKRRGRTEYGMCRITIRKGGSFLKLISSLINQIFAEIISRYD